MFREDQLTWKIIYGLAKKRIKPLLLGMASLLAVDFCQLYIPRLIKYAIDQLTIGNATSAYLFKIACYVLLLAIGMGLLRLVWRPIIFGFARKVEQDVRQALFDKISSCDLAYFHKNKPGELMARATNDLASLRMAVGLGMVAALDSLVLGLATLGFMIYINPSLAVLAALPMPLLAVAGRLVSKKMHFHFVKGQEAFGSMTELVRETLNGIATAKAYGLEQLCHDDLARSGRHLVKVNMSLAKVMGFFFPMMAIYTNLSLAVVLAFGGPLVVLSEMTPGDFVAFVAYLNLLSWPMMALGWVVSLIQRAVGASGRIDEVLNAKPKIQDPINPVALNPKEDFGITIKNLSFSYLKGSEKVLRNIDMVLPKGRVTAIVGPIGCGKTTLLNVLARLYDPPRKTVYMRDIDILDVSLNELRGHMSYAPQDAFLFSDTIRANLTLGKTDIDDAKLWAALNVSFLDQDIKKMKNGLDSKLGEKAQTLSGGQRQRLSLARALLEDSPMLILDDPLSAVDTETERVILRNLAAWRKNRTTLLVSHRLASVAFAEKIYVLEKGRVVEQGNHDYLMALKGLYHKLFAEQATLADLEK